jgi:nucleoside-diphosphate-sugar epimerase
MNVLVLGGSYFVGRHIALCFRDQGHEVTLLNRGTRSMPVPTLLADRDDPRSVERALSGHAFDVVIDCSARNAGHVKSAAKALEGRFSRYLFVSTPAVYDDDTPRPLHERSLAEGALSWAEYGINKAHAEAALRRLCGAHLTIVRPGYVYGPYNNFARETFVWSRVLRNRPVFVPAAGEAHASFVFAPDLAQVVHALALSEQALGRTFNVAHPEPVTFNAWVQAVAAAAGLSARILHVPGGTLGLSPRDYFPFRNSELTLDVSSLAKLGLAPATPLAEGLMRTYAAYSRSALESMAREYSVDLELSLVLGS